MTAVTSGQSSPAPLVARTERLDLDVDLLAVAGDSGVLWTNARQGFAGQGVALRVEVPPGDPTTAARAVHDALDGIEIDDEVGEPGTGPVALGALPFDPRLGGTLVVPELLVGRSEDGARWITTVGPPGRTRRLAAAALAEDPDRDATASAEPTRFTVTSPRPADEWCRAVVDARDELRRGEARKVVLAREIIVEADRPIPRRVVLEELRRTYPGCMLFAADGFIGASPELLVARTGDLVRSHPMAGTAPRSADPSTDARLAANLLASAKDQAEHRHTIDMVHDTLLPWCSYLDEEAEPSIVAMANVQHLATLVEGRLSSPPASVVELMRALHPTPAVNGSPRQAALDLIERYELIDRGRYGGPVGWVDAAGNGAWSVGIRSAEIEGHRARLFAGVGVVADSDPAAELAETRAKFQALLGAILRP
jgi:isochorismate synthase